MDIIARSTTFPTLFTASSPSGGFDEFDTLQPYAQRYSMWAKDGLGNLSRVDGSMLNAFLNGAWDTSHTQPSENCPPGEVEYKDIFGIKRCGKPLVSDGKGTLGDDPTHSGQKAGAIADALGIDLQGGLEDFLTSDAAKDLAKRIGLSILALVLLAATLYRVAK